MSERMNVGDHLPEGFTPYTSSVDVARAAQNAMQEANIAAQRAEFLASAAQRMEEAPRLNDTAELNIYGSKGRTYVDPTTRTEGAGFTNAAGEFVALESGKKIADKEHVVPGKIEGIKNDERFGRTSADREAYAKRYSDAIDNYVGKGYELTQAEFLADSALSENMWEIPKFADHLAKGGMDPKIALRRAEDLFSARAAKREKTVRDYAFMTGRQYAESGFAREDSFDLNQEGLIAGLLTQDAAAKEKLAEKYVFQGMGRVEAQQKADAIYKQKGNRMAKVVYENGIDSREAYTDYLKRHAPGNTAPAPKKADKAETRELPAVSQEEGKLAPEIDLRDLDKDGLRFTELLAQRNANGGNLAKADREEMESLQKKLNGGYTPIAQRKPEEITASAKRFGITREAMLKRLAKFEKSQQDDRDKGLPTYDDKLALTGDRLYNMFAADSPNAKLYVGEGGLTPKMQKLLAELNKNKGTDATWFRRVAGKRRLELTPQSSSIRRARKLEKMRNEINAERQVPLYWIYEGGEKGEQIRVVGPDPAHSETGGVGDMLVEQFRGNRQVNPEGRLRRAGNWLGKNALRLDVESGVSKREQLVNRAKRIGRVGTRGARVAGPTPAEIRAAELQRDLDDNTAVIEAIRNAGPRR